MEFRKNVTGVAVILAASAALAQTAPNQAQQAAPRQTAREGGLPVQNTNTAETSSAAVQQSNGSLYQAQILSRSAASPGKPAQLSFFAVPEPQPKTLKAHDLVTIIVNEQSTITSKGTNNMTRDSELDAKVNNFVKLNLKNLTLEGLASTVTPEISLSGTRSFQGQGEVDRADTFSARITAEIVDVKPNGTMVLQARKRIKTDEEEQQFTLTGTCRVDDVTADNSILSSQLYDLELQKNHKGDVRAATKRGFIGKLLDVFNPF